MNERKILGWVAWNETRSLENGLEITDVITSEATEAQRDAEVAARNDNDAARMAELAREHSRRIWGE